MSTENRGLYERRIDSFDDDGVQTARPQPPATALSPAFQRRLDEASRAQEELSESRQRLLVQRERLRSSGNRVRAKRVETGDLEVAYMKSLREFVNEHMSLFPTPLFAKFESVEEAHIQLRTLEEDYLQAERSLGGAEWTFTNQETDFYQGHVLDLISEESNDDNYQPPPEEEHPTPPCQEQQSVELPVAIVTQEYHDALAQLDTLRKQFDALRPQQTEYLEAIQSHMHYQSDQQDVRTASSEFESKYLDLLEEMTGCEVRVQRLRQDTMHHENIATVMNRRSSDPMHLEKQPPLHSGMVARAQTDSAIPTLLHDPKTKQRILEWLLDYLQNNAIQRTLYLNFLEGFGIVPPDAESLKDCAVQNWRLDSNEQSYQAAEDPLSVTDNSSQGNDHGQFSSVSGQGIRNDIRSGRPPLDLEKDSGSEQATALASEPVVVRPALGNSPRDGDAKVIYGKTNIPPALPGQCIDQTSTTFDVALMDLPTQKPVGMPDINTQRCRTFDQRSQIKEQTQPQGCHTTETRCSSDQGAQQLYSSPYNLNDTTSELEPREQTDDTAAPQQNELWRENESAGNKTISCGRGRADTIVPEDSEEQEKRLLPEKPKDISTMTKQECSNSRSDSAASAPPFRPLLLLTPPPLPPRPVSEYKETRGEKFSEWLRLTLKHGKSKSATDIPQISSSKERTFEHTPTKRSPTTLQQIHRAFRNL